jgi:hypothetical protein
LRFGLIVTPDHGVQVEHVSTQSIQRPRLWLRTSIVVGNLLQVAITTLSLALLLVAASVGDGQPAVAVVLMTLGWLGVFVSTHANAHWLVGRLASIRFVGFGIRGTEKPDIYPVGLRQIMSAIPFFVAITDRSSLREATSRGRALMFAAGVTSTSISTILFAALAQALAAPGSHNLLIVSILAAIVATVLTARDPRGDYAKAWRAVSPTRA